MAKHLISDDMKIQSLTELTVIAAAASTDTSIQIPTNAVVLGVSVRVITTIPDSTSFDVGVSGATTRYASALSTAVDTTSPGTADATRYYSANTSVRLSMFGSAPGTDTGRVRVTIHYYTIAPPTS